MIPGIVAGTVLGGSGPSDPDFSYVQWLLHMDGTDLGTVITDSSSIARTTVASGATGVTSSAQAKFGPTSFRSSHDSDFAATTDFTGLSFGTGDFAVELSFYAVDAGSFGVMLQTEGSHTGRWYMGHYPGTRQIYVQFNGADAHFTPTNSLALNAWNQIEWSRESGVSYFFVGGTLVYSAADTNDYQVGADRFHAGGGIGGIYPQYVDEVRITVGKARHTANFTAATAAFPDS
ncbi:hypothetical protein [Variovorax rhizosphaerae]|uniref:LamG domain-containing protein n=1 Tax=Variovorax rhizosphaerae TaxID=1836200 RepID=A0ABU8WG23_9BURK